LTPVNTAWPGGIDRQRWVRLKSPIEAKVGQFQTAVDSVTSTGLGLTTAHFLGVNHG
jgi:hypothetical protein